MRRRALLCFAAAALYAQDAPQATVSGRATDAETGAPISGLKLWLLGPNGSPGPLVRTDERGNYKFTDVAPGQHALMRTTYFGNDIRNLKLDAGGSATVDYRVLQEGEISGRVYDENKDPIVGMMVHLVMSEYQGGAIHYFSNQLRSMTNDRGEYVIGPVPSHRALYVLFEPLKAYTRALSQAPADARLRRQAYRPTYYPSVETAQMSTAETLRSGEKRGNVDIQIRRSPSYCIDGTVLSNGRPATIGFKISDAQTWAPDSDNAGGKTGPDGKFRACDLYAGSFIVTAQGEDQEQRMVTGAASVTIDREDVHNVTVPAINPLTVHGEAVWDGAPPENAEKALMRVGLLSGATPGSGNWGAGMDKAAPVGAFTFAVITMVDYWPTAQITPPNAFPNVYIKDIAYGGASVLHQRIRISGDQPLRVIAANDGGFVQVKGPAGAHIAILPDSAPTEAYLSDAMIRGDADASGIFVTPAIAPGKYYVVTTPEVLDMTPESVAELWRSRTRGSEVEVGARATVSVTLQ